MVTNQSNFCSESIIKKYKEKVLSGLKSKIREMHRELKEQTVQEAYKCDEEL